MRATRARAVSFSLALCLLCAWTSAQAQGQEEEGRIGARPTGQGQDEEQVPLAVQAASGQPKSEEACRAGYYGDNSNLCAQWKAADAAADAAWTVHLAFLSGAIIGALTFVAAAAAAIYARFAAGYTRKSVEVSERFGAASLRAYVGVETAQWIGKTGADGDIKAVIVIRNFGQTPAYNLELRRREKMMGTAVSTRERVEGDIRTAPSIASSVILGPGAAMQYTIDNIVGEEDLTSLMNGDVHNLFLGQAAYTDAFGVRRKTRWCLRVDNFGTDRVRIFNHDVGNHAD